MHRSIAVLSRNASVNANYALSLVTELRRLRLSGVVPLDMFVISETLALSQVIKTIVSLDHTHTLSL